MFITKNKLASIAVMAGLTLTIASGCRKETINSENAEKEQSKSISGNNKRAELPFFKVETHGTEEGDSTVTDGTGDEDGPKFPIKP